MMNKGVHGAWDKSVDTFYISDEEGHMKYTKEDIFRFAEEEDVEFIRLQFTDMFGRMKNMAVTASQLQ